MFVCDICHTTRGLPRVRGRAIYVYVVCLDSLFWDVAGVVLGGFLFLGGGRTVWLDFLPLSLLSGL